MQRELTYKNTRISLGKFHENFEGRKSNWEKDGLNNFMIVLLFLWLCLRLKPTHALKDGISNGVVINSGLAILPEKLCHIWTASRDVKHRKHNYPPNYRYGLNLQINHKLLHVLLPVLLAGDVATNPGPHLTTTYQPCSNSFLNCITINARSLKSSYSVNGQQTSNLTRFQEVVYIEDADLAFVTETWLNKDISNAEILTNDYETYSKDRGSRACGVLLADKSNTFISVHEIDEEQYELELITVELITNSKTK